jgi:hypothetical protein
MTSWNTFYTGTLDNINAAIAQINSNCGFPDGYTETWATPKQNYTTPSVYFFIMPPPEGYMTPMGSWTQAQMIAGVVNVTEEQSQPDWWPPFPTGGN